MTGLARPALDRALDALPTGYAGPGGAAAVLHEGRVVGLRTWGWADTERRLPFTAATMFRICSITKQFTCGLVLDRFGDPAVLDDDVRAALPALRGSVPGARALCDNQSGLRDYWALTVLCGAAVEGTFGPAEAQRLMAGAASLQFAPGTRYSYANQNFRLLGDIVARRCGRDFGELLRDHILRPAGMEHAMLCADTASMPDGTIGYEGSTEAGFRPAVNRIHWTGDAGMAACLDDMVAWEAFIDATRDDPGGLYARIATPPAFADGEPALYGFGLGRGRLFGRLITGHGGGLRGWRSYRLHSAADRVSVVVLFNHMADAREAAAGLFGALLGETEAAAAADPVDPAWAGAFLEPETGLAVRLEPAGSRVRLHYGPVPELVDTAKPADPESGASRLVRTGDDEVWMERPGDHQRSRLTPISGEVRRGIEGLFRCGELESELSVVMSGDALYGAFSGVLGQGEMQALVRVSGDVWLLPCPRALDYHPPGDWTLVFRRDGAGRVAGVRVGCWLARGVEYAAA